MRVSLRPCERCQRHIRESERTCPFCAARALPRLAVGVMAAAALTIGGCDVASSASAQVDFDEPEEAVRQTPQYGAPSYDPGPPPIPQPPPPDNRDAGPPRRRH